MPRNYQGRDLVKQACDLLQVDFNKIMSSTVYDDRVVIIDGQGRKLVVARNALPKADDKTKPESQLQQPRLAPNGSSWPDDFPPRLVKSLNSAGITTNTIFYMTDFDLLAIKGIGDTYLSIIRHHFPYVSFIPPSAPEEPK